MHVLARGPYGKIRVDYDLNKYWVYHLFQKCTNAKVELKQMLLVVDEADQAEIEENIQFYEANLTGLAQELQQLKGNQQENLKLN